MTKLDFTLNAPVDFRKLTFKFTYKDEENEFILDNFNVKDIIKSNDVYNLFRLYNFGLYKLILFSLLLFLLLK